MVKEYLKKNVDELRMENEKLEEEKSKQNAMKKR